MSAEASSCWTVGDAPDLDCSPAFLAAVDGLINAESAEDQAYSAWRDAKRATNKARQAMFDKSPDNLSNADPRRSYPSVILWRRRTRSDADV